MTPRHAAAAPKRARPRPTSQAQVGRTLDCGRNITRHTRVGSAPRWTHASEGATMRTALKRDRSTSNGRPYGPLPTGKILCASGNSVSLGYSDSLLMPRIRKSPFCWPAAAPGASLSRHRRRAAFRGFCPNATFLSLHAAADRQATILSSDRTLNSSRSRSSRRRNRRRAA